MREKKLPRGAHSKYGRKVRHMIGKEKGGKLHAFEKGFQEAARSNGEDRANHKGKKSAGAGGQRGQGRPRTRLVELSDRRRRGRGRG